MADDYIWIVTDTAPTLEPKQPGTRDGALRQNPLDSGTTRGAADERHGVRVPVEKLEQGMADFLRTMGRVVKHAQQRAVELGGMELDEIELSVEVNGEGQLSLLGSGAKVGSSGAMTLHFKKADASDNSAG